MAKRHFNDFSPDMNTSNDCEISLHASFLAATFPHYSRNFPLFVHIPKANSAKNYCFLEEVQNKKLRSISFRICKCNELKSGAKREMKGRMAKMRIGVHLVCSWNAEQKTKQLGAKENMENKEQNANKSKSKPIFMCSNKSFIQLSEITNRLRHFSNIRKSTNQNAFCVLLCHYVAFEQMKIKIKRQINVFTPGVCVFNVVAPFVCCIIIRRERRTPNE